MTRSAKVGEDVNSPELTAAKVNELAHDNTISEMDISGKASVFDLTEIPNTNWYFGIVVDEAVAYPGREHTLLNF